MADYKQLCAELLRGLDENRHPEVRYPGHLRLVMAAARAALAEPEPESIEDRIAKADVAIEASMERIRKIVAPARAALAEPEPEPDRLTHRITPDDFRRWWRETGSASPAPSPEMLLTANAWAEYCLARWGRPTRRPGDLAARPLLERVARMGDCIDANTVGEIIAISDRAAAWLRENPPGRPVAIEPRGCPTPGACSCVEPQPPVDGEVAELVEWLEQEAIEWAELGEVDENTRLHRAADLLKRLSPPQPVPVSERLPGPEDCDAYEWCWFYAEGRGWELMNPIEICSYHTHWLPAHALPLPQPS